MMSNSLSLTILRTLASFIPPFPHASGISNRLIKPLYCWLSHGPVTVTIWNGTRLMLNPCDCIGGNLCFIPHLYDRWERRMLAKYLKPDMTFVDLGANIGAYSLWVSRVLGVNGEIVSIEADPEIYRVLVHNLELNCIDANVTTIRSGVSDAEEDLPFSRNLTGNAGGSSFLSGGESALSIHCNTLSTLLNESGVRKVDFIKIDIEGYELRVLRKYFDDIQDSPALKPQFFLIELFEGPLSNDNIYIKAILALMENEGYFAIEHRGNSLFRLKN